MQSVSWQQVQTNALMSAAEVAKGTRYTEALTTSWRPPKYYRDMTEEDCDKLREKWSILVDVSVLASMPSRNSHWRSFQSRTGGGLLSLSTVG